MLASISNALTDKEKKMDGLKTGLGIVNITPPMGVEMLGYGPYLSRKCDGIHDELKSSALILDDGKKKLVIISNDLVGIDKEITNAVRTLVTNRTGIPPDNVLVAGTHTHSGPATYYARAWGECDKQYLEVLPREIAGAVDIALNNMQTVTVRLGSGYLDNLGYNRDVKDGPMDTELGVISFYKEDGTPYVFLTNFACHGVTMKHDNRKISRDYPGIAAAIVEKVFPTAKMMFLQGSCGDINPILVHTGKVNEAGTLFAGEILKTIINSKELDNISLDTISRQINLPVQVPDAKEIQRILDENQKKIEDIGLSVDSKKWAVFYVDWAQSMLNKLKNSPESSMRAEIQCMRIGNVILACNPSELFTQFSLDIKRESQMKTFVVAYANDMVGYIPDTGNFEQGAYAAVLVPKILDNFLFDRNVGNVLEEEILKMINEMRNRAQ
jgi:neutral ceramidase